ncbi:c-type cytochrome biogenesis protein CcmI [Candidatus Aerophobetes bacterium]|uniref:C-type cytochrome biogenesis protein CcmI n=1 Tax=Aerophobetes bacterium TaxID=2030807 RepID=A0A523UU76_UNCAE|nr:MAG: c-type cytochrome biogenesis protein CcmI [Candidatus Aerophobetes bacterium]
MLTIALAFISLVAVVFIVYPLIKRENNNRKENKANNKLQDLVLKKESVYASLKELEFDYRTGKLSPEDYEELRSELKDIAVSLLKKADREKEEKDREKTIEEEIELEVLKIRKKKDLPPHKERRKDK